MAYSAVFLFVISYIALKEDSKLLSPYFSTYFARGMYIYPFVNVPTSVVFSGPNVFSNICIASLKSFCNALCNSSAITSIRCFNSKFSTLHVTEDTKFLLEKVGSCLQIESAIFSANSSLNKNFNGTYLPIFSPRWSNENNFYFLIDNP
ncbi:Uncharacterised protein [Streptococcus pneumoniae]|nr:Uncharacterised protein [Streptococcus pneumoniae]